MICKRRRRFINGADAVPVPSELGAATAHAAMPSEAGRPRSQGA